MFAKQYANGFIGRDIDLIDRDLQCNCDNDKYITFHMILKGYKGLGMKKCTRINGSWIIEIINIDQYLIGI